jgi:hypothetical protein
MVIAADYPVLYVLWTMLIFYCGVTSRAGRAASDIQRAGQLLDATTRREFHQLKAKAPARASSMTEIAGTA